MLSVKKRSKGFVLKAVSGRSKIALHVSVNLGSNPARTWNLAWCAELWCTSRKHRTKIAVLVQRIRLRKAIRLGEWDVNVKTIITEETRTMLHNLVCPCPTNPGNWIWQHFILSGRKYWNVESHSPSLLQYLVFCKIKKWKKVFSFRHLLENFDEKFWLILIKESFLPPPPKVYFVGGGGQSVS